MNYYNRPDPLADYRHLGIVDTPTPLRRAASRIAWDVAEVAALLIAAALLIWIGGIG